MKLISIAAILVSILTLCVAVFLLCSASSVAPSLSSAHLRDMPQQRLERLIKAGDVESLRTDFDRLVKAVNEGLDATENLMINLRTLSFFTLLSVCF
ncbi:MAG: hypothetical protein JNM99_17575 [Verrucomicrobiaceae bacterium]|nr:hypothetical protein [Verrucomicrobiaceae bacterium]